MTDSRSTENAAPGGTGEADCSIPAFPGQFYDTDSTGETRVRYSNEGMTLRDWFASGALDPCIRHVITRGDENAREAARLAYKYADAMLKARESNDQVEFQEGSE